MSSEHVAELPEDLREWVEHCATETDRDPADVLTEAITAYQLLETDGETVGSDDVADVAIVLPEGSKLDERLESLEDRLTELESVDERISAIESEFDEKIEDVRGRVIEVKREADAKAPADHDHEHLHQQLQRALRAAEEANATGKQLSQRVDHGFENFEEILEYLTDTTDELEAKLDALARTVIDLRGSVRTLHGTASARKAAADLKAEANREGVTTAKCEDCTSKVSIGLLSTPHCPHCGTTFREVEPATGLFGSSYLRTGDRSALQGDESNSSETPEDLFDRYEPGEGQQ